MRNFWASILYKYHRSNSCITVVDHCLFFRIPTVCKRKEKYHLSFVGIAPHTSILIWHKGFYNSKAWLMKYGRISPAVVYDSNDTSIHVILNLVYIKTKSVFTPGGNYKLMTCTFSFNYWRTYQNWALHRRTIYYGPPPRLPSWDQWWSE